MPVPTPPDHATATKEDWQQFQQSYLGWLETAADEDIVADMAALPVDGRPLSPSEAWRYHQCELRRRRPPLKSQRTAKKE